MSNNKQSSVDFIVNLLIEKGYAGVVNEDEIEQAKAIHKEEHKISYHAKLNNHYFDFDHYYNEQFNQQKTT